MGIGSYETAWLSLQKLRRAMVRLGRESLTGNVEVDETLIGGVRRGGNPRENKALVVIAAEIRGEGIGRIRLAHINDNSGRSLIPFVSSAVAVGSTVITDGWHPYTGIGAHGYIHRPTVLLGKGREASKVVLPRVHRVAALMKRWILGTHQGRVEAGNITPYLDEFAFRFNRRKSPSRGQLFYRLLGQCLVHGPSTLNEIIKKH